MNDLKEYEVWFVTGSQHLYGETALKEVADHARIIAEGLSRAKQIPVKVVYKPIVTTPEAINGLCRDANNAINCVGLIMWMHTFFTREDVDRGLECFAKALRPSAYAVQP